MSKATDFRRSESAGFDDELRGYLPDQIKAWLAAGRFVLVCGNDYWLNSDGEVTDS